MPNSVRSDRGNNRELDDGLMTVRDSDGGFDKFRAK